MSIREFLTNVTIIVGVMAFAALLETVVPMFNRRAWPRGRRAANLGLMSVVLLLNWALTSAVAIVALRLSARPTTLLAGLGLPFLAEIVVGVVIVDFSTGYLAHRAMHLSPFLWRFHRIHHSDEFVDVTTTFRTHPVETVWRFLFVLAPVWLFGIPAGAVLIQRLLQTANGSLGHANVRLWSPLDRILSAFWVTPNVHKMHHSREATETNSNYGVVLSLYDRLLGTFTSPERAASVVYGLDDVDSAQAASTAGLLAMPFVHAGGVSVEGPSIRHDRAAVRR